MNNPFGSTFVYGYQNVAFEVIFIFYFRCSKQLFSAAIFFFYVVAPHSDPTLNFLPGHEKWLHSDGDSVPIVTIFGKSTCWPCPVYFLIMYADASQISLAFVLISLGSTSVMA